MSTTQRFTRSEMAVSLARAASSLGRSAMLGSVGVFVLVLAACSVDKSGGSADYVARGDGGSGAMGVGGTAGSAGTAGVIGVGAFGNSGGTGGTGSLPPDGGCAYASVESDLLPASALFVVDRTGTMDCNPPPITDSNACQQTPSRQNANQPSKWELLSGALKQAWSLLPQDTSAGLSFFSNNDVCGVNSTPTVGVNPLDATQLGSLGSALDAIKPGGGTPMVGATVLAYQHLHQEAQLAGNKFVVLITDGEDNCDAARIPVLQTEIPKALGVNIRTFVIGAPGSEQTRALLSQMAWLGGTAQNANCDHAGSPPDQGDCHFDMTTTQDFGKDLAAALQAISGTALTCEFDVPKGEGGASVDFTRVNVRYTRSDGSEVEVPQDPNGDCSGGAQGWQYAQNNTKIVLCGAVCDEVKADAKAKVDIVLGCETVTIR